MSLSIWYISKYVTPPQYAKVGSRGFFLLQAMAKLGNTCTLITSNSNHLATPPSIEGGHFNEKIDGVKVRWLNTIKYSGARSIKRALSWLHFELNLILGGTKNLPRPDVIIVSSLSLFTILSGLYFRFRYRSKLVVEIRDIWPFLLTEVGVFSKKKKTP